MKKQHLTPDGWKPCKAFLKKCKYEKHATLNEVSALIDSAVKDFQQGNPDAAKNFFDNISDPWEEKSSQLDSTKESPSDTKPMNIYELLLDDYDDDEEDKVIQGGNGQYEITCPVARLSDTIVTNKFGDLIKNKATAEELHQNDRPKNYQFGWCGVLAEALYYNNKHVEGYYIFKTEKYPVAGTHRFVKLKDGTYADSQGIWTEEALYSLWKTKDPTTELVQRDPKSINFDEKDDDITTRDIYKTMDELINKHMNGETL